MDYQLYIVELISHISESLELCDIGILLIVNKSLLVSIISKPIISSRVLDVSRIYRFIDYVISKSNKEVRDVIRMMITSGTISGEILLDWIVGKKVKLDNRFIDVIITRDDYSLMYSKLVAISNSLTRIYRPFFGPEEYLPPIYLKDTIADETDENLYYIYENLTTPCSDIEISQFSVFLSIWNYKSVRFTINFIIANDVETFIKSYPSNLQNSYRDGILTTSPYPISDIESNGFCKILESHRILLTSQVLIQIKCLSII